MIIGKWGHERNKKYIAASLILIQITFWPKCASFIQRFYTIKSILISSALKLVKMGIYKKCNNKVWNLFIDLNHNGYFRLIHPKFQRNKDCLTKLVICKGLPKYEIIQNIIKLLSRSWVIHRICNLWSKFASLTQNFNTIKTVLLNFTLSFAKYLENIEQAFSYTQIVPFFTQNCNITKTVLLNFGLPFTRAYQNMKSCQK